MAISLRIMHYLKALSYIFKDRRILKVCCEINTLVRNCRAISGLHSETSPR